ncbi:hypothetical protein JW960_23170 [candidate division KSB1 bacterium]|nr:hypothetical protein [candidate division KSB1 bacterium]
MKDAKLCTMLCILFYAIISSISPAVSQNQTNDNSQLTLPWDEFKKVIHLDENEIVISLDIYQKILAQTGADMSPTPKITGGNVILTQDEFRKLIEQMKTPTDQNQRPPFDYLITKASYSGHMLSENTRFTGTFQVHVLKKNGYLKVPLLPNNIALEDISINNKQALVVSEGGYHQAIFTEAGEYTVIVTFSIKSSLAKGPHKIDLSIMQTPITSLTLDIPLTDIDVEIPQAQQLVSRIQANKTNVSAIISPGSMVSIRWRKKVEVTEKIPPKLYSEVQHLLSIEDDALKISSDINYNILHSEVDAVRFSVPDDVNILSIYGEGIGEWQETLQDGQRLINVPFTYSKKGNVTIHVSAEKSLADKSNVSGFSGIRVLDTVRENGFIGVELKTSAEVKITESQGLEKIAVQKLPQELYNKSVKPLMYGFKYLKHPYSLVLDIQKHEKIAVPVATIHSGSAVTLFTEDGKIVHRLIYQVKNSAKQFLEIQLPDKADVWSVFVNNSPVESSIDSDGKLLVPLIRSASVNNLLQPFPVEIIYCLVQNRFPNIGTLDAQLPAVGLLASQLIWSVYLPNDYLYWRFNSTLEKEEIIRGFNFSTHDKREYSGEAQVDELLDSELSESNMKKVYKGKDYKSRFRNVPLEDKELKSQVANEMDFSRRLEGLSQQMDPQAAVGGSSMSTGVLPIQIEVPTGGQVYRFAKSIIKPDDPLTVKIRFAQNWVMRSIRWGLVILGLLLLYLLRSVLRKLVLVIGAGMTWIKNQYGTHATTIKHIFESRMTLFVLFGLVVLFWNLSAIMTMLLMFVLWVTIVYQVLSHRKMKKEAQAKLDRIEPEEIKVE